MFARSLILPAGLGLSLAALPTPAFSQDADLCFITAERVEAGEKLTEDERAEAHEACMRALSATGSVLQKYQFQEADFAIMGKKPQG
jgi:hypothetical protein